MKERTVLLGVEKPRPRSIPSASRSGLIALLLAGSLLLTGCLRTGSEPAVIVPKDPDPTARFHGAWQERPYHLPDETLRDVSGQPFNLRTSPSRPVTLLYFGYPDCPDICPTVLSELAAALTQVPSDVRDDTEVLVVNIDPDERPARVREWLHRFDPDFTGLGGSPGTVRRVATQVGVEIHPPDEHGVMLHGGQVIAFDRNDDGVLMWAPGVPIRDVADDLIRLVAEQR